MRVFSSIRLLAISLAVGIFLMGSAASAQSTGKIGYVDIDQVTQKANFVKTMLGSLEASIGDRQKALEAKQEEYTRIKNEMQRKSTVSSEGELEAMRKKAKDLLVTIEEENYQITKMVDKAKREQMEPAVDRILAMVKTIGREERFDLILRGETVLYSAESVDITQKVIDRLNRESVTGNPGAASTESVKEESKADDAKAEPAATPAAKKKSRLGLRRK